MSLGELLEALDRAIAEASPQESPALLGELERMKAVLWARMMGGPVNGTRPAEAPVEQDRFLTVKEVASRTGMSQDWVYRNAHKLPFSAKVGSRRRFSERGLERWLRQRQGR